MELGCGIPSTLHLEFQPLCLLLNIIKAKDLGEKMEDSLGI